MSALADFRPGQAVTYEHSPSWRRIHGPVKRFGGYVVRVNCALITVRLHIGNGWFITRAIRPERLKIAR